jgi:hypothetical protein
LGIQTLKGSQDYLAEQGAAALPALDEAWQRVACARDPVLETLGRMLAAAPTNQLTPTQVQGVLRRLLERSDSAPTGFLWGADYASLSDAVPIIQALLAKDPYPDIEQALVNRLAARRDGTSPADLLSHLRLWTAGFCTDAAGPRRGVCESMDNLLADAEQQLKAGRTGPARNTLDARGKTRGRGADTGGIESDGGASDHGERPLPEEPVVIAALRAWAFGPRRRLAFGDPASGRPSTRANAKAKEVLRHV